MLFDSCIKYDNCDILVTIVIFVKFFIIVIFELIHY